MLPTHSYVYFLLSGDDFDPNIVTHRLGIAPTDTWKKGDKGRFKPILEYAGWRLSTDKSQESLCIDDLLKEIVDKLFDKIEVVNDLKRQFQLVSTLEIVLYIDTNEARSTPALGYDGRTIEFLYKTGTTTDIDMYRFNTTP